MLRTSAHITYGSQTPASDPSSFGSKGRTCLGMPRNRSSVWIMRFTHTTVTLGAFNQQSKHSHHWYTGIGQSVWSAVTIIYMEGYITGFFSIQRILKHWCAKNTENNWCNCIDVAVCSKIDVHYKFPPTMFENPTALLSWENNVSCYWNYNTNLYYFSLTQSIKLE